MLLGEFHELVVLDSSSANKNHTVSSVVSLDVIREVLALDREDVFPGTKDGPAESLA